MASDKSERVAHTDGVARSRETAAPVAHIALEESVGFRMSRLVRVRREHWAGELRALGLTPPQAAILRATRDHPSQALRALARTLGIDAMSVKRCVDELETRGWVATSTRDDDRRVRVVSLTKPGEALMRRLDKFVHQQESRLREQLSRSQFELFIAVLQHLERAEGIGAHDEVIDHQDSEDRS
ncbi:MAG TPA: MarR family transcriptional regulator [Acidimicrobiales bacterium]